jgi:hypothetical protein
MSYNAHAHAKMLKEITPIFNDIWKYTRFHDHKDNKLTDIDIAKINKAKKIYEHLNTIEHDAFMRIHKELTAHIPEQKPPPPTSSSELTKTTKSEELLVKRHTWWTHYCSNDDQPCPVCTKYATDLNTDTDTDLKAINGTQWHAYKNKYKQDRAAYNSTLTYGLHATSPIIWYAHNHSHYAYVMQLFYNISSDSGDSIVRNACTTFYESQPPMTLNFVKKDHIRESIEYVNEILSGRKLSYWYETTLCKTIERVIIWLLIIIAITGIIIVSVEITKISTSITTTGTDISVVAKEWMPQQPKR